jgi:hypothetical protein
MIPSLAVCSMVRNESNGIEEWIRHYLVRGVSHFFVIDDNSDDGCYEILKKHESLGYLTVLRPEMPKIPNRQNAAYNEFIKPLIGDFDWVAILDADEFLWDSEGFSLPDYFSNVPIEISMVNVPMRDFGDNGFIDQPESIVNSFTKRAEDIQNPSKNHLKSICRVSSLSSIDFHVPNVSGDSIIDSDRLKLNHYKLQSLNRWDNLVIPRGSANCTIPGERRHSERFFRANRERMNAVEDFGLINQNKQTS